MIGENQPALDTRDSLLNMLIERMSSENYYTKALRECTDYALHLLEIIIKLGGTSGSMTSVQQAFNSQYPGLYFYPSHRVLTRLGLAFAVDSATRHYYLVPEGLPVAYREAMG